MDKQDLRNLKRRYLLELYRTAKEAFDRYESNFIQLDIDTMILQGIEKILKESYLPQEKKQLEKFVNALRDRIARKEKESLSLKYKGKKINTDFIFLDAELEAIETVIAKELGKKALEEIRDLYEKEACRRTIERKEYMVHGY